MCLMRPAWRGTSRRWRKSWRGGPRSGPAGGGGSEPGTSEPLPSRAAEWGKPRAGAEGLVEGDGRGVPVQDGPFEALVAALRADAGQLGEEGFAVAGASGGGADVEVLQVDAVDTVPGGEVQEPEGEADGGAGGV